MNIVIVDNFYLIIRILNGGKYFICVVLDIYLWMLLFFYVIIDGLVLIWIIVGKDVKEEKIFFYEFKNIVIF